MVNVRLSFENLGVLAERRGRIHDQSLGLGSQVAATIETGLVAMAGEKLFPAPPRRALTIHHANKRCEGGASHQLCYSIARPSGAFPPAPPAADPAARVCPTGQSREMPSREFGRVRAPPRSKARNP